MSYHFWPTLDRGTGQPTFIRADLQAMPEHQQMQVRKVPQARRQLGASTHTTTPGVGRGSIAALLAVAAICALVVKWAR